MFKLLIVDDEPLVQVGIKSMVNWSELGIEICGTAMNGQTALKIIEESSPDIVITDVKMPVMSGLELIKECRKRYGTEHPAFIILTSYEDFHMAKEAMSYQVFDYLVKLELTPDTLKNCIQKITSNVNKNSSFKQTNQTGVHLFYDKFFISLLHNLFESEEQFLLQSKDLNLNFEFSNYVCCYGEIINSVNETLSPDKQMSLFSSSLQMIKELSAKYMPVYALSLDTRHFALIFCSDRDSYNTYGTELYDILNGISSTLQNYYNVHLRCAIGCLVNTPQAICDSYQHSRQAYMALPSNENIVFFEKILPTKSHHNAFNISLFKNDLTKAFEEFDASLLQDTVNAICELFRTYPKRYVQALDAACNILHLAISLLPDGETTVTMFFSNNPDSYRSIYQMSNIEQIINWLTFFAEQLAQFFLQKRQDYKNHIVTNVKRYINEHIHERLSLNEVAAVFGISPSYLSQLFSRYNEKGFSEYINSCKINTAKQLLENENLKVYEIADMLGFESAFYFSKVFKKMEGISPSEYINTKLI